MAPRCSPFARPFCIAQEDGNSLQFYYNFQSSMQVLNFLGRRMYNLLESPIVTLFKGKTFNSFPTLHLFQRNSKTERPRPEGSRERSFFFNINFFSLFFYSWFLFCAEKRTFRGFSTTVNYFSLPLQ